jgi:hypothetical protein
MVRAYIRPLDCRPGLVAAAFPYPADTDVLQQQQKPNQPQVATRKVKTLCKWVAAANVAGEEAAESLPLVRCVQGVSIERVRDPSAPSKNESRFSAC